MGCDRGDSFPFDFEPNENPFGNGKLVFSMQNKNKERLLCEKKCNYFNLPQSIINAWIKLF